MRELEFLPDWYPQARRRRRWLRLHSLTSLLLLSGLALWLVLAKQNTAIAESALRAVDAQLAQSQIELNQLQVQLQLKNQLEVQRRIVSRLGLQVEMSRLIRALDQVMPKEMSLLELNLDTEELLKPTTPSARSSSGEREPPKDRRLKVRLLAISPTDVDHLNFLAGLTNTPFFQDVALTYARDKTDSGHMMREFEVTFTMNLNSPLRD